MQLDSSTTIPLHPFEIISLLIVLPMLVVTVASSLISKRSRDRAKKRATVIITEYVPPIGLTPAELGYIYDFKTRSNEFFACMLDLERRNILTLQKAESANGLKVSISSQASSQKLLRHEKFVVENLNGSIINPKLIELHSQIFGVQLRSDLVDKGYFKKSKLGIYVRKAFLYSYLMSFPLQIVLVYIVVVGIIDVFIALFYAIFFGLWLIPLYFMMGIVLTIINVRITGNYWLCTDELRKIWPKIEGYKQFVELVDLDRLKFVNEHDKQNAINEVNAYAVALNSNTSWLKRFE